ncbi:MAG: alpha-E domain-containing protein [Phototrophicales bacterium]|nr:alpha-E domain-containing protein [Phototrophicales bacterium]
MLSRVADSLYWMSRYLERAEHTARLLDVHSILMLERVGKTQDDKRWARILEALRVPLTPESADYDTYINNMTFDNTNAFSVVSCIRLARENARQVRERISTEMWSELNQLYLFVRDGIPDISQGQLNDFFTQVKNGIHTIQGITDSTLSHNEGWHFIRLGRSLERAISVSAILDVQYADFTQFDKGVATVDEYFEWLALLKSCTAFEAYTKVYSADVRPDRIAEFLLLNEEFPHSVRFCADNLQKALIAIATATNTSRNSRVHRLAGRLHAALNFDQIDEIISSGLHEYLHDIQIQCASIHKLVYETFIAYPVDSAL